MDRDEFASRTRKRLAAGPAGDRAAAAIVADADELMAWGIERHARADYPWLKRVPGAGTPAEREEAAVLAELPGGEL